MILTQEYLKQILHYNPETGDWTWLVALSDKTKIGQRAGYQVRGRWRIGINGNKYSGSRLAVLYMEGWIPEDVDHKNHNPSDDQWNNVRPCPHAKNMWNIRKHRDNSSGFKGVDLDKRRQKWRVRINVKGKDIWLGYFDNKVLAAWAYDLACLELHGDFAHINFPEF